MKKSNENLLLFYDEQCPLCRSYTAWFVRLGLLHAQGRIAYDQAEGDSRYHFNREIARNKIALINSETNELSYGIDSILRLLGTRWKGIERIGKLPIINHLLQVFYAFISYNRKMIKPSTCESACTPSQNWFWRISFFLFSAFMADWATGLYFGTWFKANYRFPMPHYDLILFSVQGIVLFLAFRLLKQRNVYEYIGLIALVSLLGAILLLPLHYIFQWMRNFGMDVSLLAPVAFGMVYMIMFEIHRRRLKIHQWDPKLSWVWVLLRLLLYPMAFKL